MKCFYALLIGLAVSTTASAQILKTEKDPKTGQDIKAAVTILASGRGQQLNFFSRGDQKLMEFAERITLEPYPAKDIKRMVINIKLKNDSVYRFQTDSTKYTIVNDGLFDRLSIIAVLEDDQLTPLLNNQVRSINISMGNQKGIDIPPISDNNRREIKRAVSYVLGDKK